MNFTLRKNVFNWDSMYDLGPINLTGGFSIYIRIDRADSVF